MANEQLYYMNNCFAYRIDEDGVIIDNINNQPIGICNQKKKEILDDYNTLVNENLSLKSKQEEIIGLLEKHKAELPDELKKLIQKPPSVESLQDEILDLKNMLYKLINERSVANDDNNAIVPESWVEPENTKRSRKQIELVGDKSGQSE